MNRAALYIPRGLELWRWLPVCSEACETNGWQAREVVRDWPDVIALASSREADLIVVASRALLPAGRRPRLVAADEMPAGPDPVQLDRLGSRRPRRLRPGAYPR